MEVGLEARSRRDVSNREEVENDEEDAVVLGELVRDDFKGERTHNLLEGMLSVRDLQDAASQVGQAHDLCMQLQPALADD